MTDTFQHEYGNLSGAKSASLIQEHHIILYARKTAMHMARIGSVLMGGRKMDDRKTVIKGVHDARRYLEDKVYSDKCAEQFIDPLNAAIMMLKEQPEIVRCKDCKHFDGIDCETTGIVNIMDTNWFCADGERAETIHDYTVQIKEQITPRDIPLKW